MTAPSTKFIFGVTLMFAGLSMLMFGTKLVNYITGFLLFLTFLIFSMGFWCLVVFHANFDASKLIISFVLSVILASVLTFFVTKHFVKVGVGILGAWTLLSVCFLVVPLFGLKQDSTGNGIRWGIYIVLGLVGFALGVWKSESVKIYLTAFIGAFFFIRGISIYAGGFPDEFALAHGGELKIEPAFYGYCAGIITLFILSVIFQKKYCVQYKDEGDELEEELLDKKEGRVNGGFMKVGNDMDA